MSEVDKPVGAAQKTIAAKAAKAIKTVLGGGAKFGSKILDSKGGKTTTTRVIGKNSSKKFPGGVKGKGKIMKDLYKKRQSGSVKSGLNFPVGRILTKMRKSRLADRVSKVAGVYVSAVMEYMISEIVEQAGGVVKDNKKKFIFPRHVYLAVEGDDEMKKYLGKEVIMPTVGRKIYTHPFLTTQEKIPAKNFYVISKDLKDIKSYNGVTTSQKDQTKQAPEQSESEVEQE